VTAKSLVEAFVEVEGDSPELRRQNAEQIAREGNVEWLYNGVEDGTIEAA
jgi:hypothetical protein